MMMPSIFGENLFDSFFDDSFPFFYNDRDLKKAEKKLYGRKGDRMMKTDIREKADGYELLVDLPGFKKEEIQAVLDLSLIHISEWKWPGQITPIRGSCATIRCEKPCMRRQLPTD